MRAFNDNIVVTVDETKTGPKTTAGGLYIPESAMQEDGQILSGTVFSIGEIPLASGEYRFPSVHVGNVIWFAKFKASKIVEDGVTYHIVPESAILAIK